MKAPLLDVTGLRTDIYTEDAVVRAVDGISFEIAPGETFVLLGESGCGKSMAALSLLRLLPDGAEVVDGRVRLGSDELTALPEFHMRDVRGRRIAMIFQEPGLSLNPVITAGDQVAEVLVRHTALSGKQRRQRVQELLSAVGIPDAPRVAAQYPFQLSGGMKQRVMIAIALACDPELLIADEPTTALDVTIQAQVLQLLKAEQRRRGMSLMLITHDLGVAAQMAHRVAVMYAGELVEIADRQQFFTRPAHPYSQKLFAALPASNRRGGALEMIRGTVPPLTREFIGCRFAERCEHAWDRCRREAPGWSNAGDDQRVRCHLYSKDEGGRRKDESTAEPDARTGVHSSSFILHPSPTAAPLLQITDLKVHFPIRRGLLRRTVGQVRAVDGVSFDIREGQTLGLVGESGCGKTTVGKAIVRLITPTGGTIMFEGGDLGALARDQARARRKDIQLIFQDPFASLDPRMPVGEIILEGMTALDVGSNTAERRQRIVRVIAEVGLPADAIMRYPHEFSGGQRQRVAIARALAVEPRLIVCDEPTSALDVSVQAQILNLLRRLQQTYGVAYLFITHNISAVEFLAHDVAVMYLGRIVEYGTVREVLEEPRHPYTRALLAAVPRVSDPGLPGTGPPHGDLPSPVNPPSGCHYHPRCPQAMAQCRETYPSARAFGATHTACCHLYPKDGGEKE
ncbi:MAG TPA: ABC transporter ATP-binding protein [Burkholderiales bacterium]|nr:ABC transporter ATP-binding protein [Burkholderiales bacterium]